MGWEITYQKLLEVKVLHHYFLDMGTTGFDSLSADEQVKQLFRYSVSDFMDINPTKETTALLNGYRLRFKKTNTGFLLGVETEIGDLTKPFIPPDFTSLLRFTIQLADPQFENYTLLPMRNSFYPDSSQQKVYQFTNRKHDISQFPNLSLPAAQFNVTAANDASSDGNPNTYAYLVGDLLSDNSTIPTTLFEALKHNNANTSDTTAWKSVTAPHLIYVNDADKVQVFKSLHNYTFTTPGINARIDVNNVSGNTVVTMDVSTANNVLVHQVDMRTLLPGQYELLVTNTGTNTVISQEDFYLDDNLYGSGTFGLIEIAFANGMGNYSLFDGSGSFQSPVFELRLKNRFTNWEYINDKDKAVVSVSGANNPLPLTRDGFISVQLNGNDLPNPEAKLFKTKNEKLVSEIFIDENLYN